MFRRILLPLDGSEVAECAIPWVVRYAKENRSMVVLLTVVDHSFNPHGSFKDPIADADFYLQHHMRELMGEGIDTVSMVRMGKPATVIIDCASRRRCDLIAMTTRGGSGIVRWLLGATVEKVIRSSTSPVLLLPLGKKQTTRPAIDRIILPIDGSHDAISVLPWAVGLARDHRAKIMFFHVAPPGALEHNPAYRIMLDKMKNLITLTMDILQHRGISSEFNVAKGDAADEILKIASGPGDMVAINTHGYSGFKRLLLGSVTEKVIHHAACPIFVHRRFFPARRKLKPVVAAKKSAFP